MNKLLMVMVFMLVALTGCSRDGTLAGKGKDVRVNVSKEPEAASSGGSGKRSPAVTAGVTRASFASLPDRGELLTYGNQQAPSQTKQSKSAPTTMVRGAYTWRQVAISEAHALRAISDGRMHIRMPSGERLEVLYDHHVEHPSGDLSWVGHVKDHPTAQTILTFGVEAVYGVIGRPGKRAMDVTTQGGMSWLIETDPAKLVGIANTGATPKGPDYLKVPRNRPQTGPVTSSSSPASQLASQAASSLAEQHAGSKAAGPVIIDLLIGYTQGYAPREGRTTRLNNLVQIGNETLANSQVNVRIRLVHSMQVNYSDTTTNANALEQLTGYDESEQRETTPHSAFNALRAAREAYGADLVTLVRPFRNATQGGCGVAWLLGSGRTDIKPSDEYFGYSVVSDGEDRAGSNTYYCVPETLIHELAHNMGAQHDRATAAGDDGELDDDDYGAFTYSFGYQTSASEGNFHTVMAYGEENQELHRVFSNPRITICGERACGTSTYEDNARALGQTAPIVAKFRAANDPKSFKKDLNGDGKSDILFRSNRDAAENYSFWTMSGNVRTGGWRESVGSGNTASAVGDFNGDGLMDIAWVNSKREVWMWFSTGRGFSKGKFVTTLGAGWSLAAAGDMNRDGKSDLLFLYNGEMAGNMSIWYMDGARRVGRQRDTVSAGNVLSASGDYNGDGWLDLVWINSRRQVYLWLGTSSGFSKGHYVDTLPAGWAIAGSGDVTGDGFSDLILTNSQASSGNLSVWPMRGARYGRVMKYTIASGTKVSAVADYNGDGAADILFTRASRDMSMWLSTRGGFSTGNNVGRLGPGWSVLSPGK